VKIIVPVILLLLIPFMADAGDIIKKGELLSIERCIEIALGNHPNIIASAYTVAVNRSRVGQSEADYYPRLDWTSGYSRTSPVSGTGADDSADSFDQYTSSVTLNQNIYDFGKTSTQVRIENLNLDSARSDLRNVSEQVVLNVRQAYYGVLAARRNRVVAADSVKQFQQHLEQAKGFFEVGTKPKFDVTKAEVDLSNSKLNLIKAENTLRIAFVTLNNAMGFPAAPEYDVEDNLSFQAYMITFEDALERAYKDRPDLASALLKKRAAEGSVKLAEKGYFPVLTGNASYSKGGEDFPLSDGWDAGVKLSFPIFSGFLTKYQVEESKASLNVLGANEELLRQTVFLEVQQAYLNLKQAEESIPVAELTVRQAEENLDIANGRYAAGAGSPIEVTDAEVSLINAKTSYIQALYDYKIAIASLEKAMGVR
jgi:outer membrane protein